MACQLGNDSGNLEEQRIASQVGVEMTESGEKQAKWLEIIAKASCYLCLNQAMPGEKSVLRKVDFLEKLGLNTADAARVAGSTSASVAELRRQAKNKEKKNGKPQKKKKTRRR